jgi:hypothetical protein
MYKQDYLMCLAYLVFYQYVLVSISLFYLCKDEVLEISILQLGIQHHQL